MSIENIYTVQGTVTKVTRDSEKKSLERMSTENMGYGVNIVVQTRENNKIVVPLPLLVNNDFGLIPYQHALLDAKVQYTSMSKKWTEGVAVDEELTIMSGPLEGMVYKHSKS